MSEQVPQLPPEDDHWEEELLCGSIEGGDFKSAEAAMVSWTASKSEQEIITILKTWEGLVPVLREVLVNRVLHRKDAGELARE